MRGVCSGAGRDYMRVFAERKDERGGWTMREHEEQLEHGVRGEANQ